MKELETPNPQLDVRLEKMLQLAKAKNGASKPQHCSPSYLQRLMRHASWHEGSTRRQPLYVIRDGTVMAHAGLVSLARTWLQMT